MMGVKVKVEHAAGAQVDSVVLLGGTTRPTELSGAIDRSTLDLPVRPGETILSHWCAQLAGLREGLGLSRCPVRLQIDGRSREPRVEPPSGRIELDVQTDRREYRGTGGVLRDVTAGFDPEARVLVASASQVLLEPLVEIVRGLSSLGGDLALVAHRDGTPSGLMLMRCGVLRGIKDVGFVDLKEQALPAIAKEHDVRVLARDHATGRSVRTRSDYIAALRLLHRVGQRHEAGPGMRLAFAEDWYASFSIIEAGASVDASARVHDSVVLDGAEVGPDATVVRSVVPAGARVGPRQTVIDAVVPAPKHNGAHGP